MLANSTPKNQQGVVLIISLIMLTLMTLIGISAMQGTGIEEKMAGNSKDKNTAFQAAETALRGGELFINNLVTMTDYPNTAGYLAETDDDPNYLDANSWTDSNSVKYVSNLNLNNEPRYIIKYIGIKGTNPNANLQGANYGGQGASSGSAIFRITSRSTGATNASQIILQSYYAKSL